MQRNQLRSTPVIKALRSFGSKTCKAKEQLEQKLREFGFNDAAEEVSNMTPARHEEFIVNLNLV